MTVLSLYAWHKHFQPEQWPSYFNFKLYTDDWLYWGLTPLLQLRSYGGQWRTCDSWLSHFSTNTTATDYFSHIHQQRWEAKITPERKFASTGYRTHNHQVMSQTSSLLSFLGCVLYWWKKWTHLWYSVELKSDCMFLAMRYVYLSKGDGY